MGIMINTYFMVNLKASSRTRNQLKVQTGNGFLMGPQTAEYVPHSILKELLRRKGLKKGYLEYLDEAGSSERIKVDE